MIKGACTKMIYIGGARHMVVLDRDYSFMDKEDREKGVTKENIKERVKNHSVNWLTFHYGCDIRTGEGQTADEIFDGTYLIVSDEIITRDQVNEIKNIVRSSIAINGEKALESFAQIEKKIKKVLHINVKIEIYNLTKTLEGDLVYKDCQTVMNTKAKVLIEKQSEVENSL